MATRSCGKVNIACTYRDRQNDYRCALSVGGQRRGVVFVGAPAHLRHAVDSPAAYDEAAHAAISFGLADGLIGESECDYTESGHRVQRGTGKRRR